MKHRSFARITNAAVAAVIAIAVFSSIPRGEAQDQNRPDSMESRTQLGFLIAPVPLKLTGKNRALVGLGSYLINAVAGCNGCHSAGPATQYIRGGNPYFGQAATTNAATYLGGGRDFGPLVPNSPHIISRNLTPDKTGRAEGGHTFEEFVQIMQTGIDMDHVHPPCSASVTTNCLPRPFDGNLLQIMPWPDFQSMSEHDLRAIYEYLSAIPCLEGGPGEPANRCD